MGTRRFVELRDRSVIESVLTRNRPLHIYELGDLDDFFFPDTRWYGIHRKRATDDSNVAASHALGHAEYDPAGRTGHSGHSIDAVALLYVGMATPTLIALADPGVDEAVAELLASLAAELPDRFDAHLTDGLADALRSTFDLKSRGKHYKMVLETGRFREYLSQMEIGTGGQAIDGGSAAGGAACGASGSATGDTKDGPSPGAAVQPPGTIVHVTNGDLLELEHFYTEAYPNNWFDPRMLGTARYVGCRRTDGRLVAVAGVHVYSPRYEVAALGNVATLPSHRGRGYGSRATAHLCSRLVEEGLVVGLNVRADNVPAVRSYRRIGFRVVAEYDEYEAHRA